MLNIITSPITFYFALSLFFAGAIGSLFLRKKDVAANMWGNFFAIAGSALGMVFGITTIFSGNVLSFATVKTPFPLLALTLKIDMLSAFFISTISLIAFVCSIYALGYVKHYYRKYDIGALGFFYNFLIASMFLIVSTSNGIFFLIAWEVMSIASFFLIIYDRKDESNVQAGYLYLTMTYIGTAFIMLAFLLLYKFGGSFDFEAMKAGVALMPDHIKNFVFISALIGFGTKAGIIPLHIWLPAAHPAAPSHVSALLSGVMIKCGIFMMIRLFLDILQPVPLWWGVTILSIGSVSSLLGVLYALTEHDLKRLLAYHSIENIGIILLGVGSSMIFYSLDMPSIALLALVAALFHVLNHAIFKSLLFLSAGSVVFQTHTRNMEEFGGLIKYMPQTAFFFLIGSMAISALPPFNGFFSEWLIFQSLLQGIMSLDFSMRWMFMLAAGSLAFTGGLALTCFVKAFGATFLARPRSAEIAHAKESSKPLLFGMGILAALSLLFGIFSATSIFWLERIAKGLSIFQYTPTLVSSAKGQDIVFNDGFASVSGLALFALFVIIISLVIFVVKYKINKNQKIKINATWDCGTDLNPRMEITATGFARSIILIFKGILKPSIQHEIGYSDSDSRYLPSYRTVILEMQDIHQVYVYKPLQAIINKISMQISKVQNGNINIYIAYIFVTLLVVILWTM